MDTLKVMAAKRPVMTYEAHLTLSSMGYGIKFRRLNNYKKQEWRHPSMATFKYGLWQPPTRCMAACHVNQNLCCFFGGDLFERKMIYNNLKSILLFSHQSSRHFFFPLHDPLVSTQAPRPGCLQAQLFFLFSFFFLFFI